MTLEQELELIQKAKTDQIAFEQLYNFYFPKILAFCLNRVLDRHVAEDITSQVFLNSIENVKKFKITKKVRFGSWLYKVAQNQIIDYYRKNKKSISIDSDSHTNFLNNDHLLADAPRDPYIQKQIAITLNQLKNRYQQIISLKFYSELENPEIAEVLGIKPTRVAVLLHRALRSFEKKYQKNFLKP